MKGNKKKSKSVKSIVCDSKRWECFSDERLKECISLCVDTWNDPTDENVQRLVGFKLINHKDLDENKVRKLQMGFETCKPGDELLNVLFKPIRETDMPTEKQIQEAVIVLNSLYNTNLQNVMTTSRNLQNKFAEIKPRIIQGDYLVIDSITEINRQGKNTSYNNKIYSFATKFCSFINPSSYRIFDRFSSNLLYMFLSIKGDDIELKQLGKYSYFIQKYGDFLEKYELPKDKNRDIDIFLWMYGKVLAASGDVSFELVSHINQG